MATLHGKKVLVRKAKAGDMVVTRINARERVVVSVDNGVALVKGTGFNAIAKPFPVSEVGVLSKRA